MLLAANVISAKAVIVTIVGVGCVGAAGIGGYLAVKTGTIAPAAAIAPVPSRVPQAEQSGASNTEIASPAQAPHAVSPSPPSARPAFEAIRKPSADAPERRAHSSRPLSEEPSAAAIAQAPSQPTPPDPPADAQAITSVAETAPTPAAEPSRPVLDELIVAANSVIGIRLDAPVSSTTARVEDRVTGRVTRDVSVDGRTAIPAGARIEGAVTMVQRGGRFKEQSRIGVRFTMIVLSDRTRTPIQTETVFRDGEPPGNEAASKIGASAVIGTILGAVLGGKKGAAIGSGVGAAGGAAAVAAGSTNDAIIEAGAPLTVRLTAPVTILAERTR